MLCFINALHKSATMLRNDCHVELRCQMSEPLNAPTEDQHSKRFKTIQNDSQRVKTIQCPAIFAVFRVFALLALRASVSVKIMAQPKPSLRGVKANVTPLSCRQSRQGAELRHVRQVTKER